MTDAPDLTRIRHAVEECLTDATRAAGLAWPDGRRPDAVLEALASLDDACEQLAYATQGDDARRQLELEASAARAAAEVHEAADLVSS